MLMIGFIVLGGLAAVGIARYVHWRRHGGWGPCGGWHHRRWHGHHGGWHGHHGGWHGHHGGWHDLGGGPGADQDPDGDREGGPDDGPGGWPSPPWRRSRPFVLRYLSERLDATPAQEKMLRDAWAEFEGEIGRLKGEGKQTRKDLAAALRRAGVDEVLLGELYARHDEHIERARKAFVGLLAKVHEGLDERQRERLASLVERGGRFVPWARRW
jgi:hypothetical protein